MKEKQEKLKEEEQRNPAVEASIGYDQLFVWWNRPKFQFIIVLLTSSIVSIYTIGELTVKSFFILFLQTGFPL